MDHTGQYVANVAGQVTKAPPSIHTVPVGSGSDLKVSEQLDGIFRHIEYASRAQTHYGIALTSAARTGVGYLIVRPEYIDRAMGYQEPRISSEADPLRVVLDPWSVQLDGSDADFGYKLTSLAEREFARRYGDKAEKVSFGQDGRNQEGHNERKSIIIAEQWYKEEKTRNVIVYTGADGEETSGDEDEYHAACKAGLQLALPAQLHRQIPVREVAHDERRGDPGDRQERGRQRGLCTRPTRSASCRSTATGASKTAA
jgi:hypothetical protein